MTTTADQLTPEQRQYVHRSPLPAAIVARRLGITEDDVHTITREEAERHRARWGGAPCLAGDEPEDTLEADLAASLRAIGIAPLGSAE